MTVIVAGHLGVDPDQRDDYLAGCRSVVELARATAGCIDFSITADLIDPGRIMVFEHWESRAAVETFRGDGPRADQRAIVVSAAVSEYDVVDGRTLT